MANTSKPLQIFKPGRHTAMSGDTLAFSESDLAACAAAYDPALFEAPIVVGHPKVDSPAYGWVKSLAYAGALDAEPHQVDPAFAEMVSAGRFKKISAAFYAPNAKNNPVPGVYYLRHVGFLGAVPPAVQGLRTPEFAEADDGVVEFSEWDDVTNASLWRSLRDWVISKFGQEEADRVIPGYQVQSLEQSAQQELAKDAAETSGAASPLFSEPSQLTKETSVTPEQKAALEDENARLKSDLAAANAAALAHKQAEIHRNSVAFAESLIDDGKLLPAEQAVTVAALDHFADQEKPIEFAEGDVTKPLAEGFKAFLGGLPKRIEFSEVATSAKTLTAESTLEFAAPSGHSVDGDQLVLHRKALAYQADHPGVDYVSAVKAVS